MFSSIDILKGVFRQLKGVFPVCGELKGCLFVFLQHDFQYANGDHQLKSLMEAVQDMALQMLLTLTTQNALDVWFGNIKLQTTNSPPH